MKYCEFLIGHAKVYARETFAELKNGQNPRIIRTRGSSTVNSKHQEIFGARFSLIVNQMTDLFFHGVVAALMNASNINAHILVMKIHTGLRDSRMPN